MCGMTGDGTGIQFVTDYNVDAYGALNVVCIHSCGTSTVVSEIVPEVFGDAQARMIQRFLEVSLHLSDNFVSTLLWRMQEQRTNTYSHKRWNNTGF